MIHDPVAARWMIAGEWRAHPARVAIAVLAIAVGVALGFAVHLVNASALDRFERGLATVNGTADLRVEAAGPGGYDERLYPRLVHVPGVAAASPAVVLRARLGQLAIDLVGSDALRAGAVSPALVGRPPEDAPLAIFDPGAVFLSADALRQSGARIGSTVKIAAAGTVQRFTVAGTIAGTGRPAAVIDIAAAQDRFGRLGRLDRIDLALAAGADRAQVRAAIAAALPVDALLATQASDAARTDALSRAYRVNLDMLAHVALLTGAFLVYSAQALSVARRRPQFALLRVLGATRGAIVAQVLGEGAVLGVAGAALGIVLGVGIAAGVLRVVGGDLGSGAFAGGGDAPPLLFAPGAALGFALLGLVAALLGSVLPAREAAGAAPAVALKNLGDAIDPRARPARAPALILLAAGGAAALLPAWHGLPIAGYLAMALLLAGGIAAMPGIARALLGPFARIAFAWPPLELAAKRLWGAPGQAAVALSGIVASTGLMIAMAVMVSSFRGSVDEWLAAILPADLYLAVDGGDPGAIDAAAQARLAAAPGVARATFSAQRPLRLAADRPPVILVVRPAPGGAYPAIGRTAPVPAGTLALWVSEPAARLYALRPGSALTLPIAGGVPAQVAGVFRDYARQAGAIAIDAAAYDRLTGDTARGEAAIDLVPGARAGPMIAALRRRLPSTIVAATQIVPVAALRARALAVFDRSFAITYGLEAVAILVGLAGVAATVSAQTIARTREFGMLRHLGVARREIMAMLGIEGALLGLVGGITGVGLGCVLAQVLIHVVNPQSFNWTMETRLPWRLLLSVIAALVAAAAGTAMLSGRRAVSIDAVRAVRDDW